MVNLTELRGAYEPQVFDNISAMIGRYTTDPATIGEMLPQSAEDLREAYRDGQSFVYLGENGEPIAHAAAWPLLTGPQFGFNLYEFGSWCVAPEMRHHRLNGHTIGEEAASQLVQRISQRDQNAGLGTAFLATVKRPNSYKGLVRVGFSQYNFHHFPLVTALTCTCEKTSEHYQGTSCNLRWGPSSAQAMGEQLINVLPQGTSSDRGIPCTLLGTPGLIEVEARLRSLYKQIVGTEIEVNGLITPELMQQLFNFYKHLGVSI